MISLSNIHLNFSQQTIFEGLSVQFTVKDRVAIVGPNGTGKTTLLRLITGEMEPGKGEVHKAKHVQIGYLSQDFSSLPIETPAIDEVLNAFPDLKTMEADLAKMEREIEIMSMANDPDLEDILHSYGHIQHQYSQLDGFTLRAKAGEILSGLGFTAEEMQKPVKIFSGGWRMRIALAKLLLKQPDYLLLDEPTNHLDLESLEWLENYLKNYDGAIIIISHDRFFLDELVKRVIELDNGKGVEYAGNYSFYETDKIKRQELLMAQYMNQQAKLAQLNQFIERFRYKASKAKQVQSRVKMLGKIDRIEVGSDRKSIKFFFPDPIRSGRNVVEGINVTKSFGNKLLFHPANFLIERGDKIALSGLNGSGKTTLVKMLLDREKPTEGTIRLGTNVSVGYFAQHQIEELNLKNTVYDEVLNEAPEDVRNKVRTILGSFLFENDDVFKRIGVLSGGEKARVALAKLLVRKHNFIVMDEPTNHLDIESKDLLIEALDEFSGTLLVISHDRYFLDQITNKTIFIHNQEIKEYLYPFSEFYERVWKVQTMVEKPMPVKKVETESKPSSGYKSKEQKRLEAEERRLKNDKVKGVRDDLHKTEKRIAEIEKTIVELDKILGSAEFYNKSFAETRRTMDEHEKLKNELDKLYKKWTDLSAIVEKQPLA